MFNLEIGPVCESGLACDFKITEDCGDDDGCAVISGHVKWDGCVNYQTDGLSHLCCQNDLSLLFSALKQAIDFAYAEMAIDKVLFAGPWSENS